VTFNIALLGYYKYTNFIIDIVNDVLGSNIAIDDIFLPLAISFYSFQQIAFLTDCRKGRVNDIRFWRYALFLSFFPQLICGPIVRFAEINPQFSSKAFARIDIGNLNIGLILFSIGLFKKVVVADNLATYGDPLFAYANLGALSFEYAWFAAIAFTFQIYFDFSAYSDMALGLARMFGVKLPNNFDSPYKAKNMYELWRRWHISLSDFMREHVYLPLSRVGSGRIEIHHQALVITILLGGLWHGANWTFVLWGAMHAALLLFNHSWHLVKRRLFRARRATSELLALAVLLTFFTGVLTRVMFRADSVTAASRIYSSLFGVGQGLEPAGMSIGAIEYLVVVSLFAWVWLLPNSTELLSKYDPALRYPKPRRATIQLNFDFYRRWAFFMASVFIVAIAGLSQSQAFIYFRF
jgi:D-alanyl-lipoteichoic acid acyltransferase DltB (MBOAT superfamily)